MRYLLILPLCAAVVFGLLAYENERRDLRQIEIAEQAVANGEIQEAIELYRELTLRPRMGRHTAEALYQVGSLSYLRYRDSREAVAQLRTLVREFPESSNAVDGRFLLAHIYEQVWRNEAKALASYLKILDGPIDPTRRAQANLATGRLHAKLGDEAQAKRAYRLALDEASLEVEKHAYAELVALCLDDGSADEAFTLSIRQLNATAEMGERRQLYLNRIRQFQDVGHFRYARRLRDLGQDAYPLDAAFSASVGDASEMDHGDSTWRSYPVDLGRAASAPAPPRLLGDAP